MRLSIPRLRFSLPEAPLAQYEKRLDAATLEIKKIAGASGTHSDKFRRAFQWVRDSLRQGRDLASVLESPLDLRALALLFHTDSASRIRIAPAVLEKISQVRAKPSRLLLEAMFSHYLKQYDQLEDVPSMESWLMKGKEQLKQLTREMEHLLGGNGPKWLAEESHRLGRDFDEQVRKVGLDRYQTGRFLTVSKNIYYLDVLRGLRPNETHPILLEMQKKLVYDSRYDENSLLGHQILKILIEKAPDSGVDDDWLNVVLAIAGDPRVPLSHPNYRKWWSQLDSRLKNKVQGWLSKLDLRLFLEALENYSSRPGNEALKRMFPARKSFIEGLLRKQLVTGSRLFLSPGAASFLRSMYKPEELPNYSIVTTESKSVLHIQLGDVHLIEGSHSCRLWIYGDLDASAIVFDYSQTNFTYSSLAQGLSQKMLRKGIRHKADIVHHPPLTWQNKAILALRELGVPIDPKDVLTPEDYLVYKRKFGV